jgi:hypothetical protein
MGRVFEMQPPDPLDRIRRGQRLRGDHREIEKAPIFLERKARERDRPAVLAGKPPGEAEQVARRADLELRQLLPEFRIALRHDRRPSPSQRECAAKG